MDYSAAVRNCGNIVTRVGTGPILERSADGRGHFVYFHLLQPDFGNKSSLWHCFETMTVKRCEILIHLDIDRLTLSIGEWQIKIAHLIFAIY